MVRLSPGVDLSREKAMRKLALWTVLVVASWAMVALVAFTFVGLYGALANVQEDDKTFNCWVMGDFNCGPSAPWHGFVNLF